VIGITLVYGVGSVLTEHDTPNGNETVFPLTTATGLTPPKLGTRFALIAVEDQNIRYWDDGTDPTTTEGVLLSIGQIFIYNGVMSAIKFIEVDVGAKLQVSYYK
jgi:hypothetical protein